MILYLILCVFPSVAGMFWRQLGVCPGDGGSAVAERGWEEVLEETLLSVKGLWHLLRP